MSFAHRVLFDVWRNEKTLKEKNAAVFTFISNSLGRNECSNYYLTDIIKQQIKNVNSKLAQKWSASHRSIKTFLSNECAWLDEVIHFPCIQDPSEQEAGPSSLRPGRPPKKFEDLSVSAKKRKVVPLLESYSHEELVFATQRSLRLTGKRDAAILVREITETSPKRATHMKKTLTNPPPLPVKYTPEEGLALYVDGHFTKHTYILMQSGAKLRHANIYPSYNSILKAKKDCYPSPESLEIGDISAEVKLQALVDHTITRLAIVQQEVLIQKLQDLSDGLKIIFKWGCDGSSGHSNYKQVFSVQGELESAGVTDSSLFAVCIVPLQMTTNKNDILWSNPKPSSTRFCRPIKLIFQKETVELTRREIANVERQIDTISPTNIFVSGEEITVSSCFKLTMIDGKTFGVISETSTQSCGICGASPKYMNDLEAIERRTADVSKYDYGLSTLHAWIRCFECILHIAYRQNIKKWQVKTTEDKLKFAETKTHIQRELKNRMGLLVDIPKPGCGTSNDGNTASRFFEQSTLASSVTSIDEELIHRFYIILQTISCGFSVNTEAFRTYAKETAQRYITLYPWYNMPSSVHKLLLHGADIIKSAVLPIGMFSEEALESRNKDFRRYREFQTRKFSRTVTMTDLLHTLLYTSDPLISSKSRCTNARLYNVKAINRDVVQLLSEPILADKNMNEEEEGDDEDDDEDPDEDDDEDHDDVGNEKNVKDQ